MEVKQESKKKFYIVLKQCTYQIAEEEGAHYFISCSGNIEEIYSWRLWFDWSGLDRIDKHGVVIGICDKGDIPYESLNKIINDLMNRHGMFLDPIIYPYDRKFDEKEIGNSGILFEFNIIGDYMFEEFEYEKIKFIQYQ